MKVPFTPVCAPNIYFGGSRFHVATRDKRLKIPKQMEKKVIMLVHVGYGTLTLGPEFQPKF